MQNLVRISKIKNLPFNTPFKPSTYYKWWHLGKHKEIFVKVGGGLFLDIDRLEKLIEASRGRQEGVQG